MGDSVQGELSLIPLEMREAQVQRVVQSAAFRNAFTSQALLQYLARKTSCGEADSLKEYTIGVDALRRKESFDPKVDPIVRVQSHRLRVRLREYYDNEGTADPIRIELPRGRYVMAFEPKPTAPTDQAVAADLQHDHAAEVTGEPPSLSDPHSLSDQAHGSYSSATSQTGPKYTFLLVGLLSGLALVVCGVLLGIRLGRQNPGTSGSAAMGQADSSDDIVKAFWSRFVG